MYHSLMNYNFIMIWIVVQRLSAGLHIWDFKNQFQNDLDFCRLCSKVLIPSTKSAVRSAWGKKIQLHSVKDCQYTPQDWDLLFFLSILFPHSEIPFRLLVRAVSHFGEDGSLLFAARPISLGFLCNVNNPQFSSRISKVLSKLSKQNGSSRF